MDNKSVIVTQFKREYWENHNAFIRIPVIVSLVFLALMVFGLLKVHGEFSDVANSHVDMQSTVVNGNDTESTTWGDADELARHIKTEPDFFKRVVAGAIYIHFCLQAIVYLVVLFGYAHHTLFDDRKNREILFWRSMPVSETTNVLVKVGFALLLAPAMIFLLNLAVTFVVCFVGIIFFTAEGLPFTGLVAAMFKDNAVFSAFTLLPKSLLMMLALLPFIGFAFLCSAYAKKSPAVMGILLPILLIVVDKILGYILGFNFHIGQLLATYARFVISIGSNDLSFANFPLLGFTIALVTGMAMVVVAIWLRNNRYEI